MHDVKLNFSVMKKNFGIFMIIISAFVLMFASCKEDPPEPEPPTPNWHWYSPDPDENGNLPESVLPADLYDEIAQRFTIYNGDTPAEVNGQFVSSPHHLFYSTLEDDTVTTYNDRYVAFISRNGRVDFYGKQWDDEMEAYYEEVYRELNVVGTGDEFTCYYITEGYPGGYFATQSTIFSAKWDPSYRGLKDFSVAVILTETSDNPSLAPKGSFRILGDEDGLARDTNWMAKKALFDNGMKVSDDDAFSMFRIK